MLLNKPLLTAIIILFLALSGSGYYIKFLLEKNAVLKIDSKEKSQQIEILKNTVLTQEKRLEDTLETLEIREAKLNNIQNKNKTYKKKLEDLSKNENDKCINEYHTKSITDLLQINSSKIHRKTNPSIPSRNINE